MHGTSTRYYADTLVDLLCVYVCEQNLFNQLAMRHQELAMLSPIRSFAV